MPRIIAGRLGGRTVPSPPTNRTRPTSDRVREAMFSRLDAWGAVEGATVLDLYAGTGALAFEALSRGAAFAVLVEAHRPTAKAIGEAARALGLESELRIECGQASVGPRPEGPFTLVCADPPYAVATDQLACLVTGLGEAGQLADEATIVLERSARSKPTLLPEYFVDEGQRNFGDTRVEYFTYLDPAITEASR
ncbi:MULTISPECIES: RsmD family RNA methyltransferase [Dermabacter]|uniref:16S rRNA (Guanine(966)-N(2))-methyltransferase RsmD n=1 Tax=Dermabacter vaginalis TaxID=1630135 RepID=A0ABX6A5E1_9MICO|nr:MULTISPECIES: RsmD family RNA methyltransferase [Dermabacter]QEU11786.1 16S rRNA (guanine(966)-N(2))-methyltransferase RsmD [Dermabacter vaginalis]RUP87345.1 16S rRNA (guanine(966)-N(2))-methyltransferase RsmD [Dermabacter sp. HSID17554]